ncbi:MCE family protein [Mycolicibacterium stellerae]|uniref:MCE family protein n=1 Tax=Mycolicibacterium stellerae TaxID=2358193 RepID=UPI000F0B8A13|nr:MCE family protein [Mycolicibacterium stellerae]
MSRSSHRSGRKRPAGEPRFSAGWLAAALVLVIVGCLVLCAASFLGALSATVPVTLTSDRAGLVMEPYSKVKMRGVQVGHVETVSAGLDNVRLRLAIDADQVSHIPANVTAKIDATTVFGSKFVDLVYPDNPSRERLSAGAVLKSSNVTVEVNTVFENLVEVLNHIDPAKLNSVLSALDDGFGGKGKQIGQSITDSNDVLLALNPRSDTMPENWIALKQFSDTYSKAAPDIIRFLSAASTTSTTLVDQSKQFDALMLSVAGFARSGTATLAPAKDNLIKAVNLLEPTTNLLMKYNPELTCLLVGANTALKFHEATTGGFNGKSLLMDSALLLGDDMYKYPDNLPVVNAKGGPGGKPGCGSLPDVANNYPVRNLVTDTGFGSGLDNRPNPGIGFPGWANFLPVTRGVPEPPVIRNTQGGPAPGPIPYPGAPPWGAPMYGPDGAPLYPGVPPAPAPEPASAPPAP